MDIKKIYSARTENVEIEVACRYQPNLSNPMEARYVFSYQITIINYNDYPVQLLRRTWNIFDATNGHRSVKGEGVVGNQPIINKGENFTYSSWCPIGGPIGNMSGYFDMVRGYDKQTIEVKIPQFQLEADHLYN